MNKLCIMMIIGCVLGAVQGTAFAEDVEIFLDSTNATDKFVVRDRPGNMLMETTADGKTGYGREAADVTMAVAGGMDVDDLTVTNSAIVNAQLTVSDTVSGQYFEGDGGGLTNLNVEWSEVANVPTEFTIETRTDDPVSPATGRMWLRTDL